MRFGRADFGLYGLRINWGCPARAVEPSCKGLDQGCICLLVAEVTESFCILASLNLQFDISTKLIASAVFILVIQLKAFTPL